MAISDRAVQEGLSATLESGTIAAMQREVRQLARERNAVILAHNYQVPEIQDVADYVGDSLGLAIEASTTQSPVIVLCGVYFMAETAKILNMERTVLIPDHTAGCSLADSITLQQLKDWKQANPGSIVVSYVNTTAEIKAESDYCVTSGNAEAVIRAIPEDQPILFLPDMYLGSSLKERTGRETCRYGLANAMSMPVFAVPRSLNAWQSILAPTCSSTPNAAAQAGSCTRVTAERSRQNGHTFFPLRE